MFRGPVGNAQSHNAAVENEMVLEPAMLFAAIFPILVYAQTITGPTNSLNFSRSSGVEFTNFLA
jgi:hypothetical protein